LLLLLAGATAAASNGDAASSNVTATTITSGRNSSSATVDSSKDAAMYTCYLCAGRNPLMIHWCPVYWDDCHLECPHHAASATAAVRDARSGPVSSSAVLPGGTLGVDPGDDDECYVMKLYNGGRAVIVQILTCGQVKQCSFLTCGGGEKVPGNAQLAVTPVPAAGFQYPRLADFQRCGDTVHMVRSGGDHSDRKG
jgi:hypothetical protein